MDRVTKADLYRFNGLTGTKGFIKAWFDPGFRYIYLLRKVIKYKQFSFKGLFYRIIKRFVTDRSYQVSSKAQIGEGFYLYHRGTVVIGPVIIGKNCNVGHNVTIGRGWKDGKIARPTIGDRVWIGSGAVIVGGINIGSNVRIAPNAFVYFDVPENSLVIGNPGKIIKKENATKYYIENTLDE